MAAYYNENEPYCVEWLRNLIREGLITDGEVDDRNSVEDNNERISLSFNTFIKGNIGHPKALTQLKL